MKEIIVFIVVILFGMYMLASCSAAISTDSALVRFQELASTPDVSIVRQSNSAWFIGDPYDVTFELRVNGKPASGRCSSGAFSPMVCRLYGIGGE